MHKKFFFSFLFSPMDKIEDRRFIRLSSLSIFPSSQIQIPFFLVIVFYTSITKDLLKSLRSPPKVRRRSLTIITNFDGLGCF